VGSTCDVDGLADAERDVTRGRRRCVCHRLVISAVEHGGRSSAGSAALCFEPLARRVTVNPIRFRDVWVAEVAVGVMLTVYVTLGYAQRNRAGRSTPSRG
jgi:hypothetical protein